MTDLTTLPFPEGSRYFFMEEDERGRDAKYNGPCFKIPVTGFIRYYQNDKRLEPWLHIICCVAEAWFRRKAEALHDLGACGVPCEGCSAYSAAEAWAEAAPEGKE